MKIELEGCLIANILDMYYSYHHVKAIFKELLDK